MIRAVIFDLNGIFLQSPNVSVRIEKDFNVPASIFVPKLLDIMNNVRKPNALPAFSYWEPILKEFGIAMNEREFWDYWFSAEVLSERMVAYTKELRERNIKVFILSNNFKERSMYYYQYPWTHEAVDKIYFSWQTGFVKPDVRAWEIVLHENNLKADECLYFDDQHANVKAAQSLGIKSYLFTTEENLELDVQQAIVDNIIAE